LVQILFGLLFVTNNNKVTRPPQFALDLSPN